MVRKVAVVGSTGQVGFRLSKELLKLGHSVVAISRSRTSHNESRLAVLKGDGAICKFCNDYADVDKMAEAFSSCDTAAVTTRASVEIIREVEPKILEAAVKAGVKRFVPNEFGVHTMELEYGSGTLFDAKKDFQKKLFASGLDWTIIYNGYIFDYFLPNFRFFEQITTFGNTKLLIATHDIGDITAVAARAIVDSRTINKAVQLYYNVLTQEDAIAMFRKYWPNLEFEVKHVSTEEITYLKDHGDPNAVSAKAGAESDRERHGINYAIFVLGKLTAPNAPNTLNANDLYPEYVYKKPEEALSDRKFVFGDDTE